MSPCLGRCSPHTGLSQCIRYCGRGGWSRSISTRALAGVGVDVASEFAGQVGKKAQDAGARRDRMRLYKILGKSRCEVLRVRDRLAA